MRRLLPCLDADELCMKSIQDDAAFLSCWAALTTPPFSSLMMNPTSSSPYWKRIHQSRAWGGLPPVAYSMSFSEHFPTTASPVSFSEKDQPESRAVCYVWRRSSFTLLRHRIPLSTPIANPGRKFSPAFPSVNLLQLICSSPFSSLPTCFTSLQFSKKKCHHPHLIYCTYSILLQSSFQAFESLFLLLPCCGSVSKGSV